MKRELPCTNISTVSTVTFLILASKYKFYDFTEKVPYKKLKKPLVLLYFTINYYTGKYVPLKIYKAIRY